MHEPSGARYLSALCSANSTRAVETLLAAVADASRAIRPSWLFTHLLQAG